MDEEERQRLQEKIAFLELQVADLDTALRREARAHHDLEDRVGALEGALRHLADRVPRGEEVAGANAVDDPVPHSG